MNRGTYQAMPRRGQLAKNLNLRRKALTRKIHKFRRDTVYSYIVKTVKRREGRLRQEGSGPNFQGDLITLCSCKHQMRAYLDVESWKGVWVAGYTRKDLGNRLYYLIRVAEAFESHYDFWFSDRISEKTKNKKAAHLSRLGDIYKPRSETIDDYTPCDYVRPRKSHVHRIPPETWRDDIDYYSERLGRRAALLVGDPKYSFLWDEPVYSYPFTIYQGEKNTSLSELIPM